MEKRTSSFESHLSVVENGHQKVAFKMLGKNSEKDSLLAKLAEELGVDSKSEKAMDASEKSAPVAEGERELTAKGQPAATPEVVAATDGVANPQLVAAGTDIARQEAGMLPRVAGDSTPPIIATGEGTATTAQNLNKTPEAVAAAARGVGGAQTGALESAASDTVKEANDIGALIAKSFQKTLEKNAADARYSESLEYLTDCGILADYDIKDTGIAKTASFQPGALKKIANNQPLSREDIVNAAIEYSELEKQASEAEAQGRQDAHNLVDLVAAIQKTAGADPEQTEQEKIATLLQDEGVVNAVRVLKSKNLL